MTTLAVEPLIDDEWLRGSGKDSPIESAAHNNKPGPGHFNSFERQQRKVDQLNEFFLLLSVSLSLSLFLSISHCGHPTHGPRALRIAVAAFRALRGSHKKGGKTKCTSGEATETVP